MSLLLTLHANSDITTADYSSYHQYWVRRHLSYSGWREYDDELEEMD